VKVIAALTYSTVLGYLVVGLFYCVFRLILPPAVALGVGAILGIRVATLFASMSWGASLNWRSIWVGGASGIAALLVWWPTPVAAAGDPPRILLAPLLIAAATVIVTARRLASEPTSHFYDSARFARGLHSVQGFILFGAALPASLFWPWTRGYAVGVTLSALLLWEVWDGACPVTLTENAARRREGRPVIPPDSGFIPDALANIGVQVPGQAVTHVLYAVGFSLCGWIGLTWVL
jgi:hypothetical protein